MSTSARKCRVCGCTDEAACAGGCAWVEADLCSRCSPRHQGMEFTEVDIAAMKAMGPIDLVLNVDQAWYLLATVQLALRHPNFGTGPTAVFAQELALGLVERLSVTPGCAAIAAAGFDPEIDFLAAPAGPGGDDEFEEESLIILPPGYYQP